MSSQVSKSKRIQRGSVDPSQLSDPVRGAVEAARSFFGSPVVLLGSRARGDWADDSDIDLGVNGYDFRKHKSVKAHLSGLAGIKVDLFKIEHARTHRGAIEV